MTIKNAENEAKRRLLELSMPVLATSANKSYKVTHPATSLKFILQPAKRL
jgi:hypothetical protein